MDMERMNKDMVMRGKEASSLLNQDVFLEAVSNVLNKYAELEEEALVSDKWDSREMTAQVRKNAMLRRATLDIVNELNDFILAGENASLDE